MIGLINPVHTLSAFSRDPVMAQVAKEVEEKIIRMIDEAKATRVPELSAQEHRQITNIGL